MYLTEVRIYGSLYGGPAKDNFKLWLCDDDFRPFACYEFPFSIFKYQNKWIELEITPTLVPKRFFVVTCYNTTAHKGVFMNYDSESSGSSFSGLPGSNFSKWESGDWMIRSVVVKK